MKRLGNLFKDSGGSVLPMAAAGILVIAILVGSSVDLSRAYKVQNRLQAACDAGVLAGRKAVGSDGLDNAAKAEASRYFTSNFDEDLNGARDTDFEATSDNNGLEVNAVASTVLKTTIMKVVGIRTLPVSVECHASMGVGNSDVTMVLDVSGSMQWSLSGSTSRISALRNAMLNFYDVVDEAAGGGNARIRYSLVPYSSSVNVGRLIYNENPSYLTDNYSYQTRRWVTETHQSQVVIGYGSPTTTTSNRTIDEYDGNWDYSGGSGYNTEQSCKNSLPNNTSWSNRGSASSNTNTYTNSNGQQVTEVTSSQDQRRTSYTCFRYYGNNRYYGYDAYSYRTLQTVTTTTRQPIYGPGPVTTTTGWKYQAWPTDTSTFKTFANTTTPTGNNGSNQTTRWDGCILERQTTPAATFSFSQAAGITPAAALDLDIDAAPTGDPATQWAPMWNQISYIRGSYSGSGGSRRFNRQDTTPTTDGQLVSSVCPAQATLLTEMPRSDFANYVNGLTPLMYTYHDVGMLWGARLSSPTGIFQENVMEPSGNASTVSRHLIFMTDGEMATQEEMSTYGVEFHEHRIGGANQSATDDRHSSRFLAICEAVKAKGIRLWVIAMATSLTNNLRTCASTDSAFTAQNTDSLNQTFEEIGKQVGELRVTQ